MRTKLPILAAAVAILQALPQANLDTRGSVRAQEPPPLQIVADQVRDQGSSCDKALTVKRDPTYSRPDEPVWILECDNASYRVRFIPGMAAKVDRLNK